MLATRGHLGPNHEFEVAAIMIGLAILTDGLDGRIARMTNTVSDFGREMDSLADVITFGLAPAVLAFAWGVQFSDASGNRFFQENLLAIGYFVSFLFLLCGAARLARFNVQTNPVPKNPGRPDRKYFVGLPIPAAAGLVASVVYASHSVPVQWWPLSIAWLCLIALLAFLMVSTWRYRSFKDMALMKPHSPLTIIFVGSLVYMIWNYSRSMLLTMGILYVGSGIVVRIGGVVRRRLRSREAHA
jgi:CDP-diacylglycerol--serine O-phosphatidyltransferase